MSATGEYNPLIGKLILSANHGMSEKSIVEHEVSMKELVSTQEDAQTVLWGDTEAHLKQLAEADSEEDYES